MEIRIISQTDREMRFVLEGVSPAFANTLRRACIGEVPVLAIDSVDFFANDSVLYDEIIAHRLALVPLVFDSANYNLPAVCKCSGKGCSQCKVVLTLDKTGPAVIYSKDLTTTAEDVRPLFADIPIVELGEGQRLKFEATAQLGLGKVHAKWQAARAGYQYYPAAEVTGKITNPEAVIKACPKAAIEIHNGKISLTETCDLCGECAKVAEPAGSLRITGDNSKFIFNITSISGLSTKEIVLAAIAALRAKLKEFERQLGKLE